MQDLSASKVVFCRTKIVYTILVHCGNHRRGIDDSAQARTFLRVDRLLRCILLVCLGLSLSCTDDKPKPEWVNPNRILPQSNRQSRLTEQQLVRVRRLQSALSEADPSTFEKWTEDFEKDQDPEKEISIWETIAAAYQSYCSAKTGLSVEAKREVLQILLVRSGTDDEAEVLGHLNLSILTRQDARDVLRFYRGGASPIEVERRP